MSEHKINGDDYMLHQTYAYNVKAHISIRVSPLGLASARTPPETATVLPKRPSLLSDDDTTSPLYPILEVVLPATSLLKEADKNLKLAGKGTSVITTVWSGSPCYSKKVMRSTS